MPWGKGLWPALWMLPVDDAYGGWAASGEIDLMEIVGEKPQEVLNSIHFGSAYPKRSLITTTHRAARAGSLVSDWHTYSVEWEPGEIRFYVDGVQTCTYDHWWSCSKRVKTARASSPAAEADLNPWPAPFDQPFYLLMNVAVGGNFPGVPNDADPVSRRTGGRLRAGVRQGRRLRAGQAAAPGVMPWEPARSRARGAQTGP